MRYRGGITGSLNPKERPPGDPKAPYPLSPLENRFIRIPAISVYPLHHAGTEAATTSHTTQSSRRATHGVYSMLQRPPG